MKKYIVAKTTIGKNTVTLETDNSGHDWYDVNINGESSISGFGKAHMKPYFDSRVQMFIEDAKNPKE